MVKKQNMYIKIIFFTFSDFMDNKHNMYKNTIIIEYYNDFS